MPKYNCSLVYTKLKPRGAGMFLIARRINGSGVEIFTLNLSPIHNSLRVSHDWIRKQHVDKNLVVADITFEIYSPKLNKRVGVTFPIKVPGKLLYSYTEADGEYRLDTQDFDVTKAMKLRYEKARNAFKPGGYVCGHTPKFDNSPGDSQYIRHSEQELYIYLSSRAGLRAIVNRLIVDIVSSQFADHGDIVEVYSVMLHIHSTKTPCGVCEIATLEMQNSSVGEGRGFLKDLALELRSRTTSMSDNIPPSSITFHVPEEGLQMFTSYTANEVSSDHRKESGAQVDQLPFHNPTSQRQIFVYNFKGYLSEEILNSQEPEVSQRTVFSSASDDNPTMYKAKNRVSDVIKYDELLPIRDLRFAFAPSAISILQDELHIPLEILKELPEDIISIITRPRVAELIKRGYFNYKILLKLPSECLQAITTKAVLTLAKERDLAYSDLIDLYEAYKSRLHNIVDCALAIGSVLEETEGISLEFLANFSDEELELLSNEEILNMLSHDLEYALNVIEDVIRQNHKDPAALEALIKEPGIGEAVLSQGIPVAELIEHYVSYNRKQMYFTCFVADNDDRLSELALEIAPDIDETLMRYAEENSEIDWDYVRESSCESDQMVLQSNLDNYNGTSDDQQEDEPENQDEDFYDDTLVDPEEVDDQGIVATTEVRHHLSADEDAELITLFSRETEPAESIKTCKETTELLQAEDKEAKFIPRLKKEDIVETDEASNTEKADAFNGVEDQGEIELLDNTVGGGKLAFFGKTQPTEVKPKLLESKPVEAPFIEQQLMPSIVDAAVAASEIDGNKESGLNVWPTFFAKLSPTRNIIELEALSDLENGEIIRSSVQDSKNEF